MTSPLRHLFALVLGLFAFGTVAFAAPVKFDIPAQPAPAALKAFIQQSGVQVVFNADDLKDVHANEVKGEFEPKAALAALIKGTGFTASQRSSGLYVIVREKGEAAVGAVKGSLLGADGRGLAGALVVLRETSQSTSTDRYGNYIFDSVPAGTYLLVATMDGYQPLHITDIVVRGGRELTLAKESMRKAVGDLVSLDPYVVRAEQITELDRYEVVGSRMKPFADGNVDIPRTINDVQPYYILGSDLIEQSGATSVGEFLKQQLSMNAVGVIPQQQARGAELGATSLINLRGLGADKTLVLVNGRRIPDLVKAQGNDFPVSRQGDLNGIPTSAIDRIEILPSSASGIYGGSAIGGVINVVLKKNYSGGEIRTTYENTFDKDAPLRSASLTYGLALENGRTHIMVTGQFSDGKAPLLQDRRALLDKRIARIQANAPTFISSGVFRGALPNIRNANATQPLVLKDGRSLNSPITFVPQGTSAGTSTAELASGLLANAGKWNLELPPTFDSPTGLYQSIGSVPTIRALTASIRREMTKSVEAFVDFSYSNSRLDSRVAPSWSWFIPASASSNPFTTTVQVTTPSTTTFPYRTDLTSTTLSAGGIVKLPHDWTGLLDYSWSRNYGRIVDAPYFDFLKTFLAANSGALNPFVDVVANPLPMQGYVATSSYQGGDSTLNDFSMRGFGPFLSLPWGTPSLATGIEYRITGTSESRYRAQSPAGTSDNYLYFGRKQTTTSAYAELNFPLVRERVTTFVHSLSAQIAGRRDQYAVDSGTPYVYSFEGAGAPSISYGEPTLNGQPFQSTTKYSSSNYTFGLKYQPTAQVTVRTSFASAFLPPTPSQLLANPSPDSDPTEITDPVTHTTYDVQTVSGGNPGLKPQSSKSWNAGIIWEPSSPGLEGLRLNVEYYRIEQFDAISSLSAQQLVDLESTYGSRVTRSGGLVTRVDTSLLNLYKMETEGWDISARYRLKTSAGIFDLNATQSIILHLKNQYSLTLPETDAAGFPSEGGAAKRKGVGTLSWSRDRWSAGWTARYFGSYQQFGAAGGPNSVRTRNGAANPQYLVAQGGDTIGSQTYHDVFLSYRFGAKSDSVHDGRHWFDGITCQLGVKNVFNREPALDVYYSQQTYYGSPYGDSRLRSYWVSVKKEF